MQKVMRRALRRAIDLPETVRARRGHGLFCPLCGNESSRFLPYGEKRRPGARCPHCGSAERHRLIWLYLKDHSDVLARRPRVLHMAPEKHLADALRKCSSTYVTLDLYLPNVDVRADITKPIPLEDASFDLVLCSHLLEHVDDDRAAMRELLRLLAPGGTCLVMTPIQEDGPTFEDTTITDPRERQRLFGQTDHVRLYGVDVVDRLVGEGLDVEVFMPAERLSAGEVERMGLTSRHRLLVCRPPDAGQGRT